MTQIGHKRTFATGLEQGGPPSAVQGVSFRGAQQQCLKAGAEGRRVGRSWQY